MTKEEREMEKRKASSNRKVTIWFNDGENDIEYHATHLKPSEISLLAIVLQEAALKMMNGEE